MANTMSPTSTLEGLLEPQTMIAKTLPLGPLYWYRPDSSCSTVDPEVGAQISRQVTHRGSDTRFFNINSSPMISFFQ